MWIKRIGCFGLIIVFSPCKIIFMYQKFLYFFLLLPFILSAQKINVADTLYIEMEPATSTRVVLYSAFGVQQKYVSYADSGNGKFKVSLPKTSHKGMYRLVFNQKTMNYIDFLYLGKSFNMQFNPLEPEIPPIFIDSDENNRYYEYLNDIGENQQQLDSIQVLFFQEQDDSVLKDLNIKYKKRHKLFSTYLSSFDTSENNQILKDLINANTRIQPEEPIRNPEEYLPFVKAHYFDTIDFNNENLIHSSVLIDKVMDYVFYLTVSRDVTTQNKLYKEAVDDVLQRMDNQEIKSAFLQAFIQSFAKEENITLTDFLFEEYYNKLDLAFQKTEFRTTLQQELKTAVGRTASDIVWEEDDKTVNLSELADYDYYIIMFWSTSCPHCMKEIPKLHDFTKEMKNVKVIAIGMETVESKGTWKSETYYYPTFSHILGLGKWENPIARNYNVFSTPNYFVLDADKKIIDKPYEMVDVKVFFNGLKGK